MNEVLNVIFVIVALILMGVFATFLVVLNAVKQEERRKEHKSGKINR